MNEALDTITTRDRFGLVTVEIDGETYAIGDIHLRMLTPEELKRAQGFPTNYIIDRYYDGTPVPKTQQVFWSSVILTGTQTAGTSRRWTNCFGAVSF